MDANAPGLWLMPSKGRATTNLPRFCAAAIATGISTPGVILVEEGDYAENHEAYDALDLPIGWRVQPVPATCTAEATEIGWHFMDPDDQWVGWLQDDLVPETQGWDVKVLAMLNGYNVVSTNDGALAPKRMNGATAWSADLVRAAGYLYPPGLKHLYLDDVWEALGKSTGCWHVAMDIMVRHKNVEWIESRDTTSEKIKTYWDNDRRVFAEWQRTDAIPAAERIMAMMEGHGVKVVKHDYRGVRLMIASPCGSGRYERVFTRALFDTMLFLKQFGADVHWADLPGCSDIALARNKLFAAFLASNDTHMLWIDDDMAWNPTDVGQLINFNKDIVAVAGPRKVSPPSFAVNVSDAHGRPRPIVADPASGLFEVSNVGFAFVLITREWATRMAQHYKDLEYTGPNGQTEVGIFLPMIYNKRWLSEDYAACHRWTALGGKVYVAPHIALGHVGSHQWEGCWSDQLWSKMQEEAAPI